LGERVNIAVEHISKEKLITSKILKLCKIPKSTYYDSLKEKVKKSPPGRKAPGFSSNYDGDIIKDSKIVEIIKEYRSRPEFQNSVGCKALHEYIERDHRLTVNHKKIYRLCRQHKLLLPNKIKKIKINKKLSKNRVINAPNKLWQFDIKTGYIHGENKYFYLLAIIDVFTRQIINYHIGYNCKAKDLKNTFQEAIRKHNPKLEDLAIRSDNGPQMTSYMFYNYVNEVGLEHEFIPKKTPNKNAFIESFFSIFEIQFLQVWYFNSMSDVFEKVVDYIDFYNNKRLHGSVYYKTPSEFRSLHDSGEYADYTVAA